MSDPALVLRPALETWLRADTEVIAAFGSRPVKVYKTLPPVNAVAPYIFIAGLDVADDLAECLDATQVHVQLDVWSLMDPPGFSQAEAIARAAKASLVRLEDSGDSPAFTIAGFRVTAAQPVSTRYLTDPSDGKTVHAVILITLSIDPV